MQANKLIATILRHESKTASYKIALVRSLNDLVLGYPDFGEQGDSIAVPLRLLAALWIGYYWPFVDPAAPIKQGHHAANKQDVSFRAALAHLRVLWTDLVGTSRPADGVFLNNELLNRHRRTQYPTEMLDAHTSAVRAIMKAIRQPIRYAGPGGMYTIFDPPRRWSELRKEVKACVAIPQTSDRDSCLVIEADIWRSLRDLSLWVEALCIHEWCLFTESISNVDRGIVYTLLTDRPDNRRPLTWERNCVEVLMMEGHQFTCPWTEKVLTTSNYDLDHLIPISVYPTNELWNLLPADSKFNQHVKRNRLPSTDRLQTARPYFVSAYKNYISSPDLEPVLRHDADQRFTGHVGTGDFSSFLAERTLSYIRTVTESRNLATF